MLCLELLDLVTRFGPGFFNLPVLIGAFESWGKVWPWVFPTHLSVEYIAYSLLYCMRYRYSICWCNAVHKHAFVF